MAKKDKKARKFVRLSDVLNDTFPLNYGDKVIQVPTKKTDPLVRKSEKVEKAVDWKPIEVESEKKVEPTADEKVEVKPESLNGIKKRVDSIFTKFTKDLPEESRIISPKDIKAWILNNPGKNISSEEFFNWFRSPNGEDVNPYVVLFGQILQELNLDHCCNVEVKGYVYDFFIEPMSLYIAIDPSSLETDDPKNKITITIDKNKIDVVDVWRKINETREGRCKPYRFLAIKERLFSQEIHTFLNEYVDWYYQKISNSSKVK